MFYNDIGGNCLKLVNVYDLLLNLNLEKSLTREDEKFDWFNDIYSLKDNKILIKLSNSK